jgi:hypothetical protein
MISQEDIVDWLKNASSINDVVEFDLGEAIHLSNKFRRHLVELKFQIDRWDLVTDTFILNTSLKPLVKELLGQHCDINADGQIKIWGSTFYFSDAIPIDYILGACTDKKYDDYRHTALGTLPTDKIKRMLELKAFW